MFTTRHYISVATLLANLKPPLYPQAAVYSKDAVPTLTFTNGQESMRQAIGEMFTVIFEDDNPRFKAEQFRKAAALV